MKLPRSSFGRTSVSGSEEQRSNRCGAAICRSIPLRGGPVCKTGAFPARQERYLNAAPTILTVSRYSDTNLHKTLQYPAKEANRSVKPASVDSLGALPRCSTSYSMDSSHRCESRRYFARVSELAYERHSECRAPYGLARSNRAAGTTYPIPYRWSYLSSDAEFHALRPRI